MNAEIESAIESDMFRKSYGEVFEGDENWESLEIPEGDRYEWGEDSTYVKRPPYFEGMPADAPEGFDEIKGAKRDRPARRQRDHRPHLARPARSRRTRRRAVPDRERRGAARVQLIRLAPRQPRGDDARHVRQRAAAQPARARHRGRLHQEGRRGAVHLRRRDGVRGRGRAAVRAGRQGVRLRLVARLGRQGPAAARHPVRDRRELRAHPPLQPRGDGRAAAAVPRRRVGASRWG